MKANRLLAFGLRPQQAEADAHIILQNAEKKQKELNELQMERREGDQGKGAKNGNSETENTENASFSNMNNSDTNQNPSLSKLKGLVKSVTRDVTERDSKPSPLIFATLAATSSPQIITGILSATGALSTISHSAAALLSPGNITATLAGGTAAAIGTATSTSMAGLTNVSKTWKETAGPEVDAMLRSIQEDYTVEYKMVVGGHSLGGLLAVLIAIRNNFPAFLVETPGCQDLLSPLESDRIKHCPDLVVEYLASPNYINTRYGHVGTLKHHKVPHYDNTQQAGALSRVASIGKSALHLVGVAAAVSGGVAAGVAGATAAVGVITKALSAPWDREWAHRQHAVSNLLPVLQSGEKLYNVKSWPSFAEFHVLSRIRNAVVAVVPFHPENDGVHTTGDRERRMEKVVANQYGYQVEQE